MEDNLSELKAREYGQKGRHPFLNSYIKIHNEGALNKLPENMKAQQY